MLAGGLVEPGADHAGAVVAFVALSGGSRGSRMFRVVGPATEPLVEELPPATTIDLGRFDREAQEQLAAVVTAVAERGGRAAITRPDAARVCSVVRAHLKAAEGLDVD